MPEQQEVIVKPEAPIETGKEQGLTLASQDLSANKDNAATEVEEDQNSFDDLEGIEFLLDEIEDQIAPLAL